MRRGAGCVSRASAVHVLVSKSSLKPLHIELQVDFFDEFGHLLPRWRCRAAALDHRQPSLIILYNPRGSFIGRGAP